MRRVACVVVATALASSCTSSGAPGQTPRAQTVVPLVNSQDAEPSATDTAAPAPGAKRVHPQDPALPAWTFPGVAGWLAFTTRSGTDNGDPWTPRHPDKTVAAAVLNATTWSEKVARGTAFRLLVREGDVPVTLAAVSPVPFDCNGNPLTMAGLRAPKELAEQAAWVVPERFADARAVPVLEPVAARAEERSFTVAGHIVRLSRETRTQGRLTLLRAGRSVYQQDFEKHYMDGAEDAPIDLRDDQGIGAPMPVGAWRIDPQTAFVVLRVSSYEGVGFQLLRLDDTPTSAGEVAFYLCAF